MIGKELSSQRGIDRINGSEAGEEIGLTVTIEVDAESGGDEPESASAEMPELI